MLLAAGAVLSILAAVNTILPPLYWFTDPRQQNLYPTVTTWSITWLGFNVFALLLAQIPYKRGERWSWYVLWMLQLLWMSLFALAPETRSARSNSPHA